MKVNKILICDGANLQLGRINSVVIREMFYLLRLKNAVPHKRSICSFKIAQKNACTLQLMTHYCIFKNCCHSHDTVPFYEFSWRTNAFVSLLVKLQWKSHNSINCNFLKHFNRCSSEASHSYWIFRTATRFSLTRLGSSDALRPECRHSKCFWSTPIPLQCFLKKTLRPYLLFGWLAINAIKITRFDDSFFMLHYLYLSLPRRYGPLRMQ